MARRTDNVVIYRNADQLLPFMLVDPTAQVSIDATTVGAMSFLVKTKLSDADGDALLSKTTGGGQITVSGAFDPSPDPAVNAQRIIVAIGVADLLIPWTRAEVWYALRKTES